MRPLRALAALAPFVLACSTLPSIPSETCGNGVVEPENDEYCDTFASGELTYCRPPGAAGACHFDCDKTAGHVCPTGLGCGTDGVCRAAGGGFADGQHLAGPLALRLSSGDFDGDGRDDLVTETSGSVTVQYFESPLGAAASFPIPVAHAHAIPAFLPGEDDASLVLTDGASVDVWRGLSDRTLAPVIFPSFPIGPVSERLIPLEALPQVPGREMYLLTGGANAYFLGQVVGRNDKPLPLLKVDASPDDVAGEIAVAGLLEGDASPCDELAWGYTGAGSVHVFTSCRPDGQGGFVPNALGPSQILLPDVTVASGTVLTVLAGRIDADDHTDLLIDTTLGPRVAYGLGDGTFHSSIPLPAKGQQDNAAQPFKPTVIGADTSFGVATPLAVGKIGPGKADDIVVPSAVLLYEDDGRYAIAAHSPGPWTQAKIGDLDGSHFGAVAALSGATLDVYKGTGTELLNRTQYALEGAGSLLRTGDFDGDFVDDLALNVTTADNGASTDSLTLLFGRAYGYPDPPVSLGALPHISEIVTAPLGAALAGEDVLVDDIADIAVSTIEAMQIRTIAALRGRADRQLTSGLSLVDPNNFQDRADHPIAFLMAYEQAPAPSPIACLASDDATGAVTRLWTATPSNDPSIGLSVAASDIGPLTTALPSGLDYERASVARFDLGPGPRDPSSIVILAPPLGTNANGMLLIARDAPGAVVTQEPVGNAATFRDWKVRACDVDADGDEDAVLLYDDGGHHRVSVVLNGKTGTLEVVTGSSSPAADEPLAIACANLDADAAQEIVVVDANGAYGAKVDPRTLGYSWSRPLLGVPGGTAVTTGDFDGDGVDDLAIATATGVVVSAGAPYPR